MLFCRLCQMFLLLAFQGHARGHRFQLTAEGQPSATTATNTSAASNFGVLDKKVFVKPSQKNTYESSQRDEVSVTLPIFSLGESLFVLVGCFGVVGHEGFNPSHRETCCGSRRRGRLGESNKLAHNRGRMAGRQSAGSAGCCCEHSSDGHGDSHQHM